MRPLTIRIPEDLKETLDSEADEYDVSTSEYVRRLIQQGREYDDIQDRLDSREGRIDELEGQLARRSQIEDKIESLPDKIRETGDDKSNPPWPVRWYRWIREDR